MTTDLFTAPARRPRVVIVGGDFGGQRVARGLRHAPAEVVLIDRVNHHLFQPLLYQVAAALLPPGDIAPSLRQVLADQPNTRVVLGEVRP
jgi:NADH:ubiquinone reductase (H+-translocating)